ncbi:MAG: hypothetical protein ACKVP7_26720 [Hyphomicrobiaceae bacterium]
MGNMKIEQSTEMWRQLVAAAEQEPVRVQVDGLPEVFVVSGAEYARFRRYAAERLIQTMERIGEKAKSHGLTQEKLDKLLADES